MGLPSDREQYIHRLGRTGRKGKEGQGMLLLAPWEAFFLSEIKNLPITKSAVPSMDQDIKRKVRVIKVSMVVCLFYVTYIYCNRWNEHCLKWR